MTVNLKDAWQTERLSFRSIRAADYDWYFREIDSDPVNKALSTQTLLAPPRHKTPEEWHKTRQEPSRLLDVVVCLREPVHPAQECHKEGKQHSDSETTQQPEPERRIGILRVSYGGYGSSPHSRACELGITLASLYQDRGYGTEVVQWALDWAFRRANMHSVNLASIEYNKRAHKCYEKCGFKFEGKVRQCFWHDRKWYDLFLYGILEDEWEELRNTKE